MTRWEECPEERPDPLPSAIEAVTHIALTIGAILLWAWILAEIIAGWGL